MAGEEKHARELIDAAEMHQEVEREKDCDDADCGCADSECGWCGAEWPCLTRRLADALEATLPGDDDWEYGVRYVENGHVHERFGLADALDDADDGTVLRRRPAGRWEPVEEVPRG